MVDSHTQMDLKIDNSIIISQTHQEFSMVATKRWSPSILTGLHAGHFRMNLSLCSQVLPWKTLGEPTDDGHAFRQVLLMLPSTAFFLLWSVALFILLSLSLLYILKCYFHFHMVKAEFLHHVGANYLFAPWISSLLLLQSTPFVAPKTTIYFILRWVFVIPIVVLDVKIYGQWFTKGKKFLSTVANPTSLMSVIGNLVGAQAATEMGWKESAVCMFSLGMAHYLMHFVTLYQRLSGGDQLPAMLRPVFFLFFAAPSVACLAWDSISGTFDTASSKMLFFLSLFLFTCLVCRHNLFKKSMRRFNVAWWEYSFPLTVLALASSKYAQEVKGGMAHGLMLVLLALSVLVLFGLIAVTAVRPNMLIPENDPILCPLSCAHATS